MTGLNNCKKCGCVIPPRDQPWCYSGPTCLCGWGAAPPMMLTEQRVREIAQEVVNEAADRMLKAIEKRMRP